jgi:bla regulator protein blaR1
MITYFINVVMCSAFLLLVYKLVLEQEKILRFNRVYLLLSISLSFVLPLLTIRFFSPILPNVKDLVFNGNFLFTNKTMPLALSNSNSNWVVSILWIIYIAITLVRLFRFCNNLYQIIRLAKTNPSISYGTATLVLLTQKVLPHSFLHYIFVPAPIYTKGKVEERILVHEYAHVKQKHSYDIIYIHLLQCFFWILPILWFYKKAIQLNHEFLADEAVVQTPQDIIGYQHLLLNTITQSTNSILTSSFSYAITKKRLLMLTKTKRKRLGKQVLVMVCFTLAILAFTRKDFVPNSLATTEQKGVPKELLTEYKEIIKQLDKQRNFNALNPATNAALKRLETIYLLMSKEQQLQQGALFMPVAAAIGASP